MKKILYMSLLTSLCWFANTVQTSAATLNVPSQYPNISSAVNAANNGDKILVGPGTYREQVFIRGKYIEIKSTSGANNTIISAGGGRTSVMIQEVPHRAGAPRTIIDGFKITGGNSPDGQGGGITIVNNADPVIQNCIISENHANTHGGGISIYNSSNPTIKNNVINNNTAALFGAGIFVVYNSSPILYGNTITNNRATGSVFTNGGSSGGGLYLENYVSNPAARSYPVVMNNTISSNRADFAGGGISMRVGVEAILEGNTFSSNLAAYGAGIHIETEGSSPVLYKNTVQNNTASVSGTFPGSGYGGGISVYASSKPRIYNNQILGNAASRGGGGIVMAEGANSTVSGNTIAGNYVADTGYYEGGGVYIAGQSNKPVTYAKMTNNIIRNNTANTGGGIAMLDYSSMNIQNNTIVKNNATRTDIPAAGGGIFIRDHSAISGSINNNIIVLNQDYQIFEERNQRISFTNNLLSSDSDGMYFNWDTNSLNNTGALNSSGSVNATGNIEGNPDFTDETGHNYSIQITSAAINAGVSNGTPSDDIRRAVRPFLGSNDIGAYEYTTEFNLKSPVFRFWSEEYRGHFYTHSESERNTVASSYPVKTWRYEFQAYDAFATPVTDSTPMYRFYSSQYKGHFYTASIGERDSVITNYPTIWSYEGPVYNVYPNSYAGAQPVNSVYRFWSASYRHHFYTSSEAEKNFLQSSQSHIWSYENARFKVPK